MFIIAILFALLLPDGSQVSQEPCLGLRLIPVETTQGNQADLEVSLLNCGNGYLVIFPRFMSVPSPSVNDWAWARLSFEVRDRSGMKLPFAAEYSEEYTVRLPQPEDLLILPPGFFFGMEVSLRKGRFAHRFNEPGPYTVRAVYTSEMRSFLLQRIGDGKLDKGKIRFDIERVFQGTVTSDTIEINLSKTTGPEDPVR